MRGFFLTVIFLLGSFVDVKVAKAEYRAFRLSITDSMTGQSREVTSNLDDIQYPTYYHLKQAETIKIQDTWMCRKRSDLSQDIYQRVCPSPHAEAADGRLPASTSPGTSSPPSAKH
jgi:hypothetical protein